MKKSVTFHSYTVELGLLIGLWFGAAIMFATLAYGVWLIGAAIVQGIIGRPCETSLVGKMLDALELIFASPLAYLLLLSLFKYISAVRPQRGDLDVKTKLKYLDNAQLEILSVKVLSVSLFISIISLHCIELVLGDKFTLGFIGSVAILLAVLIIWYCLLDRFVGDLKQRMTELAK